MVTDFTAKAESILKWWNTLSEDEQNSLWQDRGIRRNVNDARNWLEIKREGGMENDSR